MLDQDHLANSPVTHLMVWITQVLSHAQIHWHGGH